MVWRQHPKESLGKTIPRARQLYNEDSEHVRSRFYKSGSVEALCTDDPASFS